MNKKIEILKKAVTTVVGIGTAQIVDRIIKNNVHATTLPEKVTVKAASLAIGGLVAEQSQQYTDRQIDEIVQLIQKIRNRKNAEDNED